MQMQSCCCRCRRRGQPNARCFWHPLAHTAKRTRWSPRPGQSAECRGSGRSRRLKCRCPAAPARIAGRQRPVGRPRALVEGPLNSATHDADGGLTRSRRPRRTQEQEDGDAASCPPKTLLLSTDGIGSLRQYTYWARVQISYSLPNLCSQKSTDDTDWPLFITQASACPTKCAAYSSNHRSAPASRQGNGAAPVQLRARCHSGPPS